MVRDWLGWRSLRQAEELADALNARYGGEAAKVCRAALARPELDGRRRTLTRLAMNILEGAIPRPASRRTPAQGAGFVARSAEAYPE